MAAKGGGESRTGLVVFLVLFILLSIGLGVTTYYGYDAADKATKDKAKAEGDAKAWEKDKDYWKFLALTYRSYVGLPQTKDDLAGLRKQYDGGQLAGRDDNKEEHKKAIAELWGEKSPMKWDYAVNKPTETYQDDIDALKKKLDDSQKALAKANKERDDANALAEANKREVDKAKADFQKKFDEHKERDAGELTALRKTVGDLQNELKALGDKPLARLDELKKENDTLVKTNTTLNKELTKARQALRDRADEVARSQSASDIDVSKINPDNLAKIVSIGGNGDMPYISLGSADNLKRQVTFSVFGKGVDGKPLREPKGKLEVIRVTGDHLAQARVTELRDERRDPILPGDFIYNPAWNPNIKQHVVIIGTIDLSGDHRDGVRDFIRTLQNQNVEVDAFMDMRTKKLLNAAGDGPGEMTRRTDLLIVGDAPSLPGGVVKGADAQNDALAKMQEIQKEAERLGVRIVRLNNFLEMSGYALPKPLGGEGGGKIDFHKNLEAAGSPVERKDKPK
jgi:regulator of replication initiation timing